MVTGYGTIAIWAMRNLRCDATVFGGSLRGGGEKSPASRELANKTGPSAHINDGAGASRKVSSRGLYSRIFQNKYPIPASSHLLTWSCARYHIYFSLFFSKVVPPALD